MEQEADFAIVVGGYNSSNTSHLVELCEEKLTTYFISGADKIAVDNNTIFHYDLHTHNEKTSIDFLPLNKSVKILISSGASCPDAIVEAVIEKIALMKNCSIKFEELKGEMLLQH